MSPARSLEGPLPASPVFAGRIADTGRDPLPIMAEAVKLLAPYPEIELIWASPRELLNIFQADDVGCHIITATNDILQEAGTRRKVTSAIIRSRPCRCSIGTPVRRRLHLHNVH